MGFRLLLLARSEKVMTCGGLCRMWIPTFSRFHLRGIRTECVTVRKGDTSRTPRSRRRHHVTKTPAGAIHPNLPAVEHEPARSPVPRPVVSAWCPAFRPQEGLRRPAEKTIDTLCRP